MHACLSCFSVFKSEIKFFLPQEPIETSVEGEEQQYRIQCPTIDCLGQVIDLDELILPSIFILNFKGYVTRTCCSGHVQNRLAQTYVMFDSEVELPDIPHGFTIDVPEELDSGEAPAPNYPTIRKVHDSGDRLGSILLANKKLYDWTRGLPNLNEDVSESASETDRRQNELLIMRMLAMGFSPYKQNIPPLIKKKAKQG